MQSPTQIHVPAGTPPPWGLAEERVLSLPLERVGRVLPTTLRAVTGRQAVVVAAGRWHVRPRLPLSLFDCRIEVTAGASERDESWSVVTVSIEFEANTNKLATYVWMIGTLIGIPIATRWRASSIRNAEKFAARVMDAIWSALLEPPSPYR